MLSTHSLARITQCVLVRCYKEYPQQVLWSIACLTSSSNLQRRNMAARLIEQVSSRK